MKTTQLCMSRAFSFAVSIPSKTRPDKVHVISGVMRDGDLTCSCEAFTFSGRCRHTKKDNIVCGWREDVDEPQTDAQRAAKKCPRCGFATATAQAGDAPGDDSW